MGVMGGMLLPGATLHVAHLLCVQVVPLRLRCRARPHLQQQHTCRCSKAAGFSSMPVPGVRLPWLHAPAHLHDARVAGSGHLVAGQRVSSVDHCALARQLRYLAALRAAGAAVTCDAAAVRGSCRARAAATQLQQQQQVELLRAPAPWRAARLRPDQGGLRSEMRCAALGAVFRPRSGLRSADSAARVFQCQRCRTSSGWRARVQWIARRP